jgi:hypothetical protein
VLLAELFIAEAFWTKFAAKWFCVGEIMQSQFLFVCKFALTSFKATLQ